MSHINVPCFVEPLTTETTSHCELLNPRGHCHANANTVLDAFVKQLMLLFLLRRVKYATFFNVWPVTADDHRTQSVTSFSVLRSLLILKHCNSTFMVTNRVNNYPAYRVPLQVKACTKQKYVFNQITAWGLSANQIIRETLNWLP